MSTVPTLLYVDSLVTGYGKKQVINGVTLHLAVSEILCVIGHNGAGKSTLLKAVFGLIPVWSGRVLLDGRSVANCRPPQLLRLGVSYVPQGNCVFNDLTVRENLRVRELAIAPRRRFKDDLERVLVLFPVLEGLLRRRAGALSGGEKQVLALAMGLVPPPRLLLLDEPSLGLAPPLVKDVLAHLERISRETGVSVLIVEQKVREVLQVSSRAVVLRNGSVSYIGAADELRSEAKLRQAYL